MIEEKIVMMFTDELIPYNNNPRVNDGAVDAVAKSIEEFGFRNPIIVDKNNVIIAGHTRLKASQKLGLKKVPVIVADDLTDEQANALRLVDNKTNELAEWDFARLKDELEKLPLTIDMSAFDFDMEKIDNEVRRLIDEDTDTTEDEAPEVDEENEPVTKLGDIYKLGNHRLMCGDAMKSEDVEKLMCGQLADMVFTDPPYGYKYQSNMRDKSKKFDIIKNDDKILDFMPVVKQNLSGFAFICTTWKVLDKWIPLFKKYFELTNMVIWDKGGGSMGDLTHTFSTDYEIILVSNNGKELIGNRIGSVWTIKKDDGASYVHPTQKPVSLSATAIKCATKKGDIVLDLFGGSGSTLMACEQLNRKCYMLELDPRYCDVIVKRWEKFTGKKAEKEN